MNVENMKNIGQATAHVLRLIGVRTDEDLRRMGAIEAFKKIQTISPHPWHLPLLYSLHAAILDTHWRSLSHEVKTELRGRLLE